MFNQDPFAAAKRPEKHSGLPRPSLTGKNVGSVHAPQSEFVIPERANRSKLIWLLGLGPFFGKKRRGKVCKTR